MASSNEQENVRDEDNIPLPLLERRHIQVLKVDGLLLELVLAGLRELAGCSDGAAPFADLGEPLRGEDLAKDVLAGRSSRSENEGDETYERGN